MASSSPLDSPLEMRWMVMGGNNLLWPSERPIGAPSRTRCDASMTASRIGRFVTTSPEIRKASSTGTELPDRMLKVRVKRAVLKPRVSLPMSGRRSTSAVEPAPVVRVFSATAGSRSAPSTMSDDRGRRGSRGRNRWSRSACA